jgi:hypothetical protein
VKFPLLSLSVSLAALLVHGPLARADEPTQTRAAKPCQGSSESWTYSEALKKDWKEDGIEDFEAFLSGKTKAVQGFADALALRAKSQSREGRMLAEYWMSRALLQNSLPHVAHSGFMAVAAQPVRAESAWIQAASAGCLAQIDLKQPGLGVAPAVLARLTDLPTESEDAQALAAIAFRQALGSGPADAKLAAKLLEFQSANASFGALSRGLWAARNRRHAETVAELDKFLAVAASSPLLARYTDTAHLFAARALYALDKTGDKLDSSIVHYKQINKSSNELAESLTELAWAYLMAERYSEAIGTSVSLQAGGLRHTFTPESNMVMAMALNEICQYPESVRAVRGFQKSYEPSHAWIKGEFPKVAANLYPLAVGYIKKTGTVPRAVASEWVRSPVFISSQGELNLLIDEKAASLSLSKAGSAQQDALVAQMLELLKDLQPRFAFAKKEAKEGEELPSQVVSDLRKLRKQLISFYRLRKAAPIWRTVLARHEQKAPQIRARRLAEINRDLRDRTERMGTQIEEIAENIQLVEVEIYNGASQDIIWQNAHPGYKAMAKQMKDDKARASRDQVWDWGRAVASDEEQTEIWEDELGSFKADLFDNCSSKDKFLALKLTPKARNLGSN